MIYIAAAKRKMTENLKKKICAGNGEWEVCDNGKPTDGSGVQAIQQRDRMNGTKRERKSALVMGYKLFRHLCVNCR